MCQSIVFNVANALCSELCEVTEVGGTSAEVPIQYQCLECLALFDTPEVWMAHRQTHTRSSTHSTLSTETEFVLQPDGSVTQVQSHVQNLVLDEQRAGQILTLAQVCFTFMYIYTQFYILVAPSVTPIV